MFTPHFLLTSLIVVLIPGTGVLYTISVGLRLGHRASAWASLGCTAGIIPHLAASTLGMAALLHTCALAFQGLKYAGAAYLLYLAWGMWRDKGGFNLGETPAEVRPREIALKAFLMNILNPKLSIFFLAFLPQFIAPGAQGPLPQMLGMSAVFMAMTLAVFLVYGLLAHTFRKTILDSPRVQSWFQRGFAATFAALGLDLAFSER